MAFFNEFKKFIARGNVIDLAVGIIIGTAFTGIVNSLVNDILMPPIGLIIGGIDFSNLFIDLSDQEFATLAEAKAAGVATINYGIFINALINFLIIAFAVFILVRQVNKLWQKVQADEIAAAPPPAPAKSEILLEEIRDLLKTQSKK